MTWRSVLTVVWLVYVLGLMLWIILQKRSPASTVSWILSLALLPVAGYVIYYFFGPQRLRRFRLRRLRSRTRLAAQAEAAQAREHVHEAPPQIRQMARLGYQSCDNPLSTAKTIDLLVDGAQTFDAIFEAIRQARHHVHIETYIYETDNIGTAMRDLLAQKAGEGVTVRLLIDAVGSVYAGRRFFAPLLRAGGQVAFFHDTKIGRRVRPVINYRTHRKIVVCDGRIGFVGGLNITDDEDERTNPAAYHDVHLRLQGGAVRWLQMVFLEDWVYTHNQRGREVPVGDPTLILPDIDPGPHYVQILHCGPNDERESIHRMQVAAINNATRRVWLTTPYFVPTQPAMMSLTSAAMRGVDVRLLVPERSDSLFVSAAARSYFDELIAAGGKVWEFRERMLHSKTLLTDDDCSFVGTANFDNRGFRVNYEVCALVYGPTMAARLAQQFEADLKGAAQVMGGRKEPRWRRFFDSFARLFSPLL